MPRNFTFAFLDSRNTVTLLSERNMELIWLQTADSSTAKGLAAGVFVWICRARSDRKTSSPGESEYSKKSAMYKLQDDEVS